MQIGYEYKYKVIGDNDYVLGENEISFSIGETFFNMVPRIWKYKDAPIPGENLSYGTGVYGEGIYGG